MDVMVSHVLARGIPAFGYLVLLFQSLLHQHYDTPTRLALISTGRYTRYEYALQVHALWLREEAV